MILGIAASTSIQVPFRRRYSFEFTCARVLPPHLTKGWKIPQRGSVKGYSR
jgi:hypothetical protein